MAANDVPCCEPMFWVYLIVCVALVCFAGLMSGLTLGLMSLSLVELEILSKAGEPQERKNAEKILPLVKNQHQLLCTLLIGNALAMEALPIFLDSLLPAWVAILISVTLILAFGEIIPQAVCSRYGLSVGAKLSVLVRLIVVVIFPLAYPISKLLDWLLGKKNSALLRRAELKTLVDMHGNEAGKGGELTHDETTIITGALDMIQKSTKDAMTPISEIFALDLNARLDEKTMGLIVSKGHSRVPIYHGNPANIIGFILVKNLIKFRPEDETPIRDLTIRRIPKVNENVSLYDMLNIFQTGYSHIAAVVRNKKNIKDTADRESGEEAASQSRQNERDVISMPSANSSVTDCLQLLSVGDEEVIGIITLEDVMEELIQEEIFDETDLYVDVHKRIQVNMVASRSPGASSTASDTLQRSRAASPMSPYHPSPFSSNNITPVLRSPIKSPYIQSPVMRPALYVSPTRPSHGSPAMSPSAARYLQSPSRVSRKSYEKLGRPDGS